MFSDAPGGNMSESPSLPPISSSGRGTAKAFAKAVELLNEEESALAFLYMGGGSNVMFTRARILVWPYEKPQKAVEFPTNPMPTLEKRGFLSQAYLVGVDQEVKLALSEKDLITLTGLLNQEFGAPIVDEAGDSAAAGGSLNTWIADSGVTAKHLTDSLADGETLLVLAGRVSDTSFFVTSRRLGIVRMFMVFGEPTPVIFAQHRLASVGSTTFAKAIKNIKVTLETRAGTKYDYAKVRPTELDVVERITKTAIEGFDAEDDCEDIVEFAALMEDHVATVHGYGWMKRIGDNNREVTAKGEGSTDDLFVFQNAILQAEKLHIIDADVSAEVTSNGGVQVTHRPTMTRMAAGAILPGTALIPGLAFQKKKAVDSRTTYFVCAHPEWMLDVNVDPDSAGEALKAAKYINKRAETLAAQRTAQDGLPGERTASTAEQLREMKALLDEGIITQEDFDKFKAGLLS